MTSYTVDHLLIGRAQIFTDKGETSAIAKAAIYDPLIIGFLGIEGDEVADPTVHGGPDKAIHHYPRDHYAYWQTILADAPILEKPGAFGENISTTGLLENVASIGDRYRLGSAIVEIAQGRQPCWKLGHRFGVAKMPAMVVATGKSGWYYRVIETGIVSPGDMLELLDRPLPAWTVARVFGLLIAGKAKKDKAAAKALADMPQLATTWRIRAGRFLE